MRRWLGLLAVLALSGCATTGYRYVDNGAGGYYSGRSAGALPVTVGIYGGYGYGWGGAGYWGAPFGYGYSYGWWPYPTYVHRPRHVRDRGDVYRESVRQAGARPARPGFTVPRDAARPFVPTRAPEESHQRPQPRPVPRAQPSRRPMQRPVSRPVSRPMMRPMPRMSLPAAPRGTPARATHRR